MPELYDLVEKYKPSIIWSDGAPATSDYWKARQFLAWLYNESPVRDHVVVNDRWGADAECRHGDFWNCEDQYHPGQLMERKWESCVILDKHSWGYRREASLNDYMSTQVCIFLRLSGKKSGNHNSRVALLIAHNSYGDMFFFDCDDN